MTDLKEKMRRYLFPTYKETIEDLKAMQEKGRHELKVYGFSIGDIVYIDGKLKGEIVEVLSVPHGYIPNLNIRVKTSGRDAAQYMQLDYYRLSEWVIFPCTFDQLEKAPVNYNAWTKEEFKSAILEAESVFEKAKLLAKMKQRDFDD